MRICNKRNGFTLIEMLLGIIIVSLLTGLLFTLLFQTNRANRTVDRIVGGHSKMILVYHLMTRDLAGAYIPLQYVWQQEKQKVLSQKKINTSNKQSASTTNNEEGGPLLEKIFYADGTDDTMNELTFITTNPLPSYWDGKVGKAKPRIVRVTYRLQKNETKLGKKALYTLMREESFDLKYPEKNNQQNQRAQEYPLIEGIHRMAIMYTVTIPSQSPNTSKNNKKEEKVYATRTWNVEPDGGNPELRKHSIVVPQLVSIDLIIEEAGHEERYTFTSAVQALGIQQMVSETTEQKTSPANHTDIQPPQGVV